MPNRPLTVEVFRDAETPGVDVEQLFAGVLDMSAVARGLTVVRSGRALRFSRPGTATADMSKVRRLPRFSAHINLIATSREIISGKNPERIRRGEQRRTLGEALSEGPLRDLTRLAVIHVGDKASPRAVTRHEVGHLLGVRPRQLASPRDPNHCALADCTMFPTVETLPPLTFAVPYSPGAERASLRERFRRSRVSDYMQESVRPAENYVDFCGDCSESIGKNAFFLTKHISGELVLDALLPHYDRLQDG